MADLGDLLRDAARGPTAPLDVAAVRQRAVALQRRQQGVVACAVLLLLGLSLPMVVRQGGNGDSELRQVSPTSTPTDPTASGEPGSTPDTGGSAPAQPGPSVAPEPSAGTSAGESGGPGPVNPQPSSTSPVSNPTDSADFPPRSDCVITLQGVAPGQTVTCRFTATGRGGWAYGAGNGPGVFAGYDWDMQVTIRHNGVETSYGRNADCGTNTIEAGDQVTLMLKQFSQGYSDYTLSGGVGHSC
jgi:hypothetical protein